MHLYFVPVSGAFDETVHLVQNPWVFLSEKCALAAQLVFVGAVNMFRRK